MTSSPPARAHPVTLLSPAVAARLPGSWAPVAPARRWFAQPSVRRSLDHCRAATRLHAKSFYFASVGLREEKRLAAYAIYAFCRWVDDRIDLADTRGDAPCPTLLDLEEELAALLAGTSEQAFGPAFAEVTHQYGIDPVLYRELIEGCCGDREPRELPDWPALELYCYQVASVVGLMMARLFGLEQPAGLFRAAEMGVAMQLTNILRDVAEDLARGRVYLPATELAAAGLTRGDLERGMADARWQAFLAPQLARARRFFAAGALGLDWLAPDGSRFTARLMATLYAGILDEIERADGDVFAGRVYVSTRRKCWITLRTLAQNLWPEG